MLRGFLTFCSLLPLVHCTRQSSHSYAQILAESRSVPKVIYDALREAGALVKTKLDTLQEANRLAEQRQADSSAKIDEKMQAMKAMQTKTEQVSATAKASRELMLQVDAAAAKHSKVGDEHRRSMAAFGKASEDLEDMAKKVTLAEQKLRDIVADSKRELGDLQSQWDKMSQEKEQAEAEMMELKTQAMSAGKFKTGVQEEHAKVERDMQLAQQELQGIHRALETAVSAATVAEVQEEQAVNEAREANGRVHVAKKTREYLMKIRRAVQAYYDSINELESAVDGKANLQLKDVPEAKTVLEKYTLMLSAFGDLHAYDAKVYQKVTAAKEEVKNNAFAQLRFICDLLGMATSEDGHCLAGLWTTFGMSKLPFPDEVVEKAPGAPQEAPEEDEEDDDIDLTPQVSSEEDEDEDIDMAPEKDAPTQRTAEETLKPEPLPEPALVPEVSPAKNRKRKRVSDEPLADLPLPAPKRFKRSAPEPEEPPLVPEVPKASPAKNRKRKRVSDEPLSDLPLPAPKRFKRSAPEPEEPPLVPEVPKVSPAKNRKRKRSESEYDPLAHQRVTDEPLPDLPLPAPKRFKRSAPEPEEPPLVPEVPKVSPAKNLKRKRVSDEPLADLPLPAPKRFKRSAPEPEEPPPVPEVPKVSPAKNRKRKRSESGYDPLAHQRVTDEPLPDLPLPAPKRFKRSAPEPEEPPLVPEVPKVSPAKNLKRKRVTDEPLPDLPLPAPKRFKRSAPEPEEPPLVPEVPKVSPAKNLKRKRVSDEPLADLPLPAPKRFKRSAPEPEEPPLVPEVPKVAEKNLKRSKPEYDPLAHRRVTDEPLRDLPLPLAPEVPKSMEMPTPTSKLHALECGGARVHWASCSKRDGCRYVKKADASRCGVSQHGCYDESQLPSECQLSLAPAPPSGCGGGAVHFASCYKKSGCRYVKKEDVTRCGVSLYGCYAVKELPLACQPKVRGVRVRLS